MAAQAPSQEESNPGRLEVPVFVVEREDLITAALSFRRIARELTAAAARIKDTAPAAPAFGELPSGERCTVEQWAVAAFLGVANEHRKMARQAIHEARAERRSKALCAARRTAA
jgi:hypothetical protein